MPAADDEDWRLRRAEKLDAFGRRCAPSNFASKAFRDVFLAGGYDQRRESAVGWQQSKLALLDLAFDEVVELGRACVHRDHRRGNVLDLLWRGIAAYTRERKARYLIGCSSLTSQDPALGHAMYARLAPDYLVDEPFRTSPLPAYALPAAEPLAVCPKPPRLLRTYLSVGSKICGVPALDREFGTIDFLTLLDLNTLTESAKAHFGV